jgi:hypothetical protein
MYLVVAVGRVPGLRLDRTGAALIGAALMVATGAIATGRGLSRDRLRYAGAALRHDDGRHKSAARRLFRLMPRRHRFPCASPGGVIDRRHRDRRNLVGRARQRHRMRDADTIGNRYRARFTAQTRCPISWRWLAVIRYASHQAGTGVSRRRLVPVASVRWLIRRGGSNGKGVLTPDRFGGCRRSAAESNADIGVDHRGVVQSGEQCARRAGVNAADRPPCRSAARLAGAWNGVNPCRQFHDSWFGGKPDRGARRRRRGVKIRFLTNFLVGAPVTLVSLAFGILWLSR